MRMQIPIVLAYHKITNKVDFGINTIKIAKFKEQIGLIAKLGYNPTTFHRIEQGENNSGKSIVIVFDDGYEDCYTDAAPVLRTFGFPAVIFPVINYIGKYNLWEPFFLQRKFKHMTKEQLIELSREGYEIGSHGFNHLYLPGLDEDILQQEISDSKKILEDWLGNEVITFCYPYGYFNRKIYTCVQNAGYHYAVAAPKLIYRDPITNFTIPKQSIYATDSLSMLTKKINNIKSLSWPTLSQWLIQKGAFASIALNSAKKLLKSTLY